MTKEEAVYYIAIMPHMIGISLMFFVIAIGDLADAIKRLKRHKPTP